jgi:GntR family transcriptional regulator
VSAHDVETVLSQATAPRYRQILEELRRRIQTGDYPVGSQLPTESDICTEFDASRYTVREALRGLVEMRMVSRRRGSGSVVTADAPAGGYVQKVRSLGDLFQFALDTHFDVIDSRITIPKPDVQQLIGGAPGENWLLVTGIRREAEGGRPLCFTRSYIPERLAWIAPDLPGCEGPFYALLEQRTGEAIVEAEQEIAAETATTQIARALGTSPGAVTLRVLRRYVAGRGTLIASFNWHQSEFRYHMSLHRADDEAAAPR